MSIIKPYRYNKVTFDGTYYIKEFEHYQAHLTDEWSVLYDGLYNKFPNITPELIDFVPGKKIVMEAVEGLTPHEIKYDQLEWELQDLKKLLVISQKLNAAFAEYSLDLKDTYYCYHSDLNSTNIIIQDLEQLKFKFIDIDAIRFDYSFMRQSQLDIWVADIYSELRCMEFAKADAIEGLIVSARK
jgi:hypothetical protein